jgi:GNAT superfamily N-acetyltransferase
VASDVKTQRAKVGDVRLLSGADDRASFCCGEPALDGFFRDRAGQNQRNFLSATYATHIDGALAGLLTVAAGEIDAEMLPERTRSPGFPVPILVLARMGADEKFRGRDVGHALVLFTLQLARDMASQMGCVGVALDAKPAAVGLYRKFGFSDLLVVNEDPNTTAMFLSMKRINKLLAAGDVAAGRKQPPK